MKDWSNRILQNACKKSGMFCDSEYTLQKIFFKGSEEYLKILIVEDTEEVSKIMEDSLKSCLKKAEIKIVKKIEEAKQALKDNGINLIITDQIISNKIQKHIFINNRRDLLGQEDKHPFIIYKSDNGSGLSIEGTINSIKNGNAYSYQKHVNQNNGIMIENFIPIIFRILKGNLNLNFGSFRKNVEKITNHLQSDIKSISFPQKKLNNKENLAILCDKDFKEDDAIITLKEFLQKKELAEKSNQKQDIKNEKNEKSKWKNEELRRISQKYNLGKLSSKYRF